MCKTSCVLFFSMCHVDDKSASVHTRSHSSMIMNDASLAVEHAVDLARYALWRCILYTQLT